MTVYIVIRCTGDYEDYRETIEKVFTDKNKADKYIKEEDKKIRQEEKQEKKCADCVYAYNRKGRPPKCYKDNGIRIEGEISCENFVCNLYGESLSLEEFEVEE